MGKKFHFKVEGIEDRYSIIMLIGTGTYGTVYKCRGPDGQVKALKEIKIRPMSALRDGFPLSALREIDTLHKLSHANVVALQEIVSTRDDRIFLVFEYCEFDICGLLYSRAAQAAVTMLHIVSYQRQLLAALAACHAHRILHRDIKPANIFVTAGNVVKLGDFGLARRIAADGNVKYSSGVITLFYRAPEVLMGSKHYGPEVDVWSAGCVLFEMAAKEPLFRSPRGTANRDLAQLETIFGICGTPKPEDCLQTGNNALFEAVKIPKPNRLSAVLREKLPYEFKDIVGLLESMLKLSPSERITAEEALNHPFFGKFGDDIEPCNLPALNIQELHLKNLETSQNVCKQIRPNQEKNKLSPSIQNLL